MALRRERASQASTAVTPLFRNEVLKAQLEPLHGAVTMVMPPAAWVAALVSILAVLLLGLAAWLVEVPQRAHAVGVLMPPDGFVRIVAAHAGRITDLQVAEGQQVSAGQVLVGLTADGNSAGPDAVVAARHRSLLLELSLRGDIERQEQRARVLRAQDIDRRITHINEQLAHSRNEIELLEARNTLLTRRLEGLQLLVARGNASDMQLDQEQLSLLQSRATVEALNGQAARIERERSELRQRREDLDDEEALRSTEHAILREQLQRQLSEVAALVGSDLRAPREGVVARVMVRPGQAVQSGQTLVTLYRGTPDLEAWLYLPSASAGALHEGQAVELRFDAYPHQIFGTQSAVVSSISAIALLPAEVDVPLALPGPVFEVRAELGNQSITASGRKWTLPAGTAVRADLVQQRYRLYEWFLGLRRDQPESADSSTDA
jgi:membrane fusion protein